MNHLSSNGAQAGLEDLLRDLNVDHAVETEGKPEVVIASTPAIGTGELIAADTEGDKPAEVIATVEPQPEKPAAKAPRGKKGKKASKTVEPAGETPAASASTDATPEPAAETKKPVEKRVFFGHNKLGRLEHRLGADLGKTLLLTVADSELEGDERAAAIEANKAAFKSLAVKVQNRATNIIEFVSGKTTRMNPVVELALRLLSQDRKLVTGEKGNLGVKMAALYNEGSARSMANSTMGALKALKIVTENGEKQTYVPNEDSAILALLSGKMLLSFVDVAGILDEVVAQEQKQLADQTPDAPETEPVNDAAPVEGVKVEEPVTA